MTHRERHRRLVSSKLLPSWGLVHLAEWRWLKLSSRGAPVCPLDGGGSRRPYESLLLCGSGGFGGPSTPTARRDDDASSQSHLLRDVVLLGCPGAHSRKPCLAALLRAVAPPGRACELFARELEPGVVAWGNEPLRFQAEDCFVQQPFAVLSPT